jgi:hypothetical protein
MFFCNPATKLRSHNMFDKSRIGGFLTSAMGVCSIALSIECLACNAGSAAPRRAAIDRWVESHVPSEALVLHAREEAGHWFIAYRLEGNILVQNVVHLDHACRDMRISSSIDARVVESNPKLPVATSAQALDGQQVQQWADRLAAVTGAEVAWVVSEGAGFSLEDWSAGRDTLVYSAKLQWN